MESKINDIKKFSDIEILAGAVAHGLRNPLAAIKLAVYNMKRKRTGAEEDRHLLNIDKKIEESEKLINSLLLYSQIKSPHFDEVDIYELLLERINFVKANFKRCRLKVSGNIKCSKRTIIEADPLQIKEMFDSILNNAYEAVIENDGMIEVGMECVSDESFRIYFKDTGLGIEDADLPRVFEPFFTTKAKGIGLGLAMSREIIKLHHGTIDIVSKKEEGTTITVMLPKRSKIAEKNSYN